MLLLFLPLLMAYVALGLLISLFFVLWMPKRLKNKWPAIGGALLTLGLFFGDEIFAYFHWRKVCDGEAGVFIHKVVPVQGFAEEGSITDSMAHDYLQKGYEYVESGYFRDFSGSKIYRYELQNGLTVRKEISAYSSQYLVASYRQREFPPYVWGSEQKVLGPDGEVLAEHRLVYYKGGAVIRFLRSLTGAEQNAAERCGDADWNTIFESIPPITKGDR